MKALTNKERNRLDDLAIEAGAALEKYMTYCNRLEHKDLLVWCELKTGQTFVYTRNAYRLSLISKAKEIIKLEKES